MQKMARCIEQCLWGWQTSLWRDHRRRLSYDAAHLVQISLIDGDMKASIKKYHWVKFRQSIRDQIDDQATTRTSVSKLYCLLRLSICTQIRYLYTYGNTSSAYCLATLCKPIGKIQQTYSNTKLDYSNNTSLANPAPPYHP